MPKEILYERGKKQLFESKFGVKYFTFELDDWAFSESTSREKLLKHFEVNNLKGFGVEHLRRGVIAAGVILQYLDLTQHLQIGHITSISRIEEERYVRLDKFTIRNLELVYPLNEGGTSLLDIIDRTITPMGARMLRRWLMFPLKDKKAIDSRLDIVDYFFKKPDFRELVSEKLHQIGDLERIISKVSVGRVSPRDIVQLKIALQAIVPIKEACQESEHEGLNQLAEKLDLCEAARDRIAREIKDDAPYLINKGGVIADGVDKELDERVHDSCQRETFSDAVKRIIQEQRRSDAEVYNAIGMNRATFNKIINTCFY